MSAKRRVHFIGIGGIGMSAIAEILLRSGYEVSGSDLRENHETEKLRSMGASVHKGHAAGQLQGADTVVYSSAVAQNNPEMLEAKRAELPILSRAEMLAELMRKKRTIVVAGAHGKTTTSAMVATMLLESGFDPTAVIGGRLKRIAGNAKMGTDDWFVAESDESDGSFLKLLPTIAVITNIDREHLDHYGTYAKLEQAFVDFANRVPFDGIAVVCKENPASAAILPMIEKPVLTYGIGGDAELTAEDLRLSADGSRFNVRRNGTPVCEVRLPAAGRHNVLNALAAAGVGLHLGLPAEKISKGLEAFTGIDRRLEIKGTARGVRVIDDYAHHPTEIAATLSALRIVAGDEPLRVLFQPHRYSRVADLWDLFVSSFDQADDLVVTPLYAASEKPVEGVDSEKLAEAIARRGKTRASYAASIEAGVGKICEKASKGIIVTMGAGDITKAGAMVLSRLEEKS